MTTRAHAAMHAGHHATVARLRELHNAQRAGVVEGVRLERRDLRYILATYDAMGPHARHLYGLLPVRKMLEIALKRRG